MNSDKWIRAGSVGVDAGLIWIGDPCYIIHKDVERLPKELGGSWQEFCDILQNKDIQNTDENTKNKVYDFGITGVSISSGYGDGKYPVYIKIQNGRVKEAKIVFIDDKDPYDDDDDDFEDDYEDYDDEDDFDDDLDDYDDEYDEEDE